MNASRALLVVLIASVLVAHARSDPIWPADNAWHPVAVGGNYYVDPLYQGVGTDVYATPPEPEELDLVGGADHHGNGVFATGFWANDGANLLFRVRVDNEPLSGPNLSQLVWLVFLNTDADSDVDWAISLDNKTDNQIELVQAVSGGPSTASPWNPVVLAGAPHDVAVPIAGNSRIVNASTLTLDPPYGGSHFHDAGPADDDFFIDFAFPISLFEQTLLDAGQSVPTSLQFAFATSADHININKDLPDYAGWSDPEVTVPEPGTAALLLLGGTALAAKSFRRRTRRLVLRKA